FSRCITAKMRRLGFLSAASIARHVDGRPAPIVVLTLGKSTISRSGKTGIVSFSLMKSLAFLRDQFPSGREHKHLSCHHKHPKDARCSGKTPPIGQRLPIGPEAGGCSPPC